MTLTRRMLRWIAALLIVVVLNGDFAWRGLVAAAASALPTGGEIVSGDGTISLSGQTMTVEQRSQHLVAEWATFDIGPGASVVFTQPSADAVAVNRVTEQRPSEILGSLSANGRVYLINPEGIVFGQGAQVNAGALVASTLDIVEQDWAAGSVRFQGSGGTITNSGSLDVGVVALIAPVVRQRGTITGDAALVGGTDVTLDLDGDGLIQVRVHASTVETLVENSGLIQADGGLALLTARGASDALRGVVQNSGTIQAGRLAEQDGRIVLVADMEYGEVIAGGEMAAPFIETSGGGGHRRIRPADGDAGRGVVAGPAKSDHRRGLVSNYRRRLGGGKRNGRHGGV